jgi:sugar lactone lactonase YvrE
MLWVAHWGGSGVSRFNPNTGEKLAFIKIPATFVTSCIFGGENLDELYITTAARDPGTLAREPLAGSVFVAKPGVKGLPCTKFNG